MKIQRKKRLKEMVSIRLEPSQLKWWSDVAEANGLTMSDVFRQIINWAKQKQIGIKKKTLNKTV
jgi:antitoxin component of RelBE/YafQ-DinJ toxin-antitoxin module